MKTLTVAGTYSNWVVTPLKKVRNNPVKVMLTFEYMDESDVYEDRINDYKNWKNIWDINDLDKIMKNRWIIK